MSNGIGSVQDSVMLVVKEVEEDNINAVSEKANFESNPVKQKDFGEYVASLHACNNSAFICQYQVHNYIHLINLTTHNH